jgi:hypothetical protein
MGGVIGDLVKSARVRAEFAPAIARSIVGADASERSEPALNKTPFHREVGGTGFEDDSALRGAPLPGAVEVQLPSADVDEASRRW